MFRSTANNYPGLTLLWLLSCIAWGGLAPTSIWAAEDPPAPVAPAQPAPLPVAKAFLIPVPLPITDKVDTQVTSRIERLLGANPAAGEGRPTIVLEFKATAEQAGDASDFGRALNLARYLTSERFAAVQTVAYVPATVRGHAVLPVLACERIIMADQAELGPVDLDGKLVDSNMADDYRKLASARRTVPPAIAAAMVGKNLTAVRVTTPTGVIFEVEEQVKTLREAGRVIEERSVHPQRQPLSLTGREMRELGFTSHLANDLAQLETALGLPLGTLRTGGIPTGGYVPLLVELKGPIHNRAVTRVITAIRDAQAAGKVNLILLWLDSRGGNPTESVRLARYLTENLREDFRTVAIVERQLRGDALLIPLACDELLMLDGAELGNSREAAESEQELQDLPDVFREIARQKGKNWSLLTSLIDSQTPVFRYANSVTGEVRYLSPTEAQATLRDEAAWQKAGEPVGTTRGLSADKSLDLGLSVATLRNREDLQRHFQLPENLRPARPNWALEFVEWLANPWLAGLLLFFGIFALWVEISTPGVSVPGFVGVVCLLLYFWSQFLHGNAGWLEILLFLGGAFCIALEVMVLPGFGIFGIGGGVMMVAAIILASQTFIIPHNAYQMRQMPISILMVAAAASGGLAAMGFIRRYLPKTPYLNRMLLNPPEGEELNDIQRRESVVDWAHLAGKQGLTTTQLFPSGKARFGDEVVDVMSQGEHISKGTAVAVVQVLGSRVVVRAI